MSESVLTTITWLIPVGPLLAFTIIILFLRKNPRLSFLTAWAGIIAALILGWSVAFTVFGTYWSNLGEFREELAEAKAAGVAKEELPYIGDALDINHHPVVIESSVAWLPIGDYYSEQMGAAYAADAHHGEEADHGEEAAADHGEEAAADHGEEEVHSTAYTGPWFMMGVMVDPLTSVMLFMVPFAVFMIFIYSVGYHNFGQKIGEYLGIPNHGKQEPMFARFFALMSLFAGAMLTLVVSDNLLLLFVGWEVMGFCSYMLIGFWYAKNYDDESLQKLPPRKASIKAFMTTRIADVVMLMGILFFYRTFGTLSFSQALTGESIIAAIDTLAWGASGIGLMAVMIFVGTVGKSAQFPFHVWLPNAMEGPTPVSAVIHAAAMVSAGIFLLLRIFPLIAVGIAANPVFSLIIAGIGAFTALMAATMAVAQYDVKGVLAYSTISQLGFMVAAIGIGAYVAAAFHLITHAYFKALLFLGSGSVIHGMEHGAEHVHDHHTDPQDMRNMGGLMHKMPITFWTFVIGGMALSGFPLITAGFWSKDEIFAEAWYNGPDNFMGYVVFIMLALAAALTAFYTTRQICLTFLGKPRTPLAEHAHESNGFMTLPLVLLSFFALAAGFVGIPDNFLGTEKLSVFTNHFHHLVGATVHETIHVLYEEHLVLHEIATIDWSWIPIIFSVVVALGGIGVGYMMYGRNPIESVDQEDPVIAVIGRPIFTFLENKWYWDELYDRVFVQPTTFFSEVIVYEWIDKGLIDGTLHLIANTIYAIGRAMLNTENAVFGDGIDWIKDRFLDFAREWRTLQSGKVQEYALLSMLIAFVFATFILLVNAGILGAIF